MFGGKSGRETASLASSAFEVCLMETTLYEYVKYAGKGHDI